MGNLVDTYIIAPKFIKPQRTPDEDCLMVFMDLLIDGDEGKHGFELAKQLVPDKWRNDFALFVTAVNNQNEYYSLHDIIEGNFNIDGWGDNPELNKIKYDHRYRGECLRQIIRRVFYNTLLIVENTIDMDKCNRYIVLRSNDVISEGEIMTEQSEDEKVVGKVAKYFTDKGYELRSIDGKIYPPTDTPKE